MDLIYLIYVIILTTFLVILFLFSYIPKTSELSKVFDTLIQSNPLTVAFTLGWNDTRNAFENVYYMNDERLDVKNDTYDTPKNGIVHVLDGVSWDKYTRNTSIRIIYVYSRPQNDFISELKKNLNFKNKPINVYNTADTNTTNSKNSEYQTSLKFKILYEQYPTDIFGKLSILSTHGKIIDKVNGFEVTGIGSNFTFGCPKNYEGPTCKIKPLCSDSDYENERTLPINYDQFSSLKLYQYSKSIQQEKTRKVRFITDKYHERIKVKCNKNKTFTLKACQPNRLLDFQTLKCQVYDLCNDRFDGFKHNFPISENDQDLKNNEYYLCKNNKSIRSRCENNTLFSRERQGCVENNVCLGKNRTRILNDANSYIQCSKDWGELINCPRGIETKDDEIRCKPQVSCKPQIYYHDNSLLRYAYEAKLCPDIEGERIPDPINCGSETKMIEFERTWPNGPKTSIKFSHPISIYDKNKKQCRPPIWNGEISEIMKPDGYLLFHYTNLMNSKYKYSITKKQFICSDDTNFYWNYDTETFRNYKTNEVLLGSNIFADTSFPCHTKYLKSPNELDFVKLYPNLTKKIEYIYNTKMPYLVAFEMLGDSFQLTKNTSTTNKLNDNNDWSIITNWPRYNVEEKTFTWIELKSRVKPASKTGKRVQNYNDYVWIKNSASPPLGFTLDKTTKTSHFLLYCNDIKIPPNANNKLFIFTISGNFDTPLDVILPESDELFKNLSNDDKKILSDRDKNALINKNGIEIQQRINELLLKQSTLRNQRRIDILKLRLRELMEAQSENSTIQSEIYTTNDLNVLTTNKHDETLAKPFPSNLPNFDTDSDFE